MLWHGKNHRQGNGKDIMKTHQPEESCYNNTEIHTMAKKQFA